MSLLFYALQRAQNETPNPDKSASGNDVSGKLDDAAETAAPPAVNRLPAPILPYAAAIIALLSASAIGYYFLHSQIGTTRDLTVDVLAAASRVLPASAVQLAESASTSNTEIAKLAALPATASGPDNAVKPATSTQQDTTSAHQMPPAKRAKHQTRRKQVMPVIQAVINADPLRDGYLALSEGSLDQAEKSYLAALAQHPHEKDALLGLAVTAKRKLQTARATDLYRQVLREDIGNATAAAGLVSLLALADPLTAESQLRELLDIKPASAELHYALGSVLARQLRLGDAQQSFFRAYSLAPDNSLYAYNLAVSLDRLHQTAAALPYYEKAARQTRPGDKTLDMSAINRRIEELSAVTTESR